jgi:tetratricopeptide (TPR) repeat protein
MGPILLRANLDLKKPEIKKFLILKDVYKDLKKYDLAVEACQFAARMKPDDLELSGQLKDLSALDTMYKGNYTESKGFRGSMVNQEKQDELLGAERDVRSQIFLDQRIAAAEKDYEANPNEPGKLSKLVESLTTTEQMEHENRAIELLQEWYEKTKQYRFRRNIGIINMKIWNRMDRAKRDELKLNPNDPKLKEEYDHFLKDKLEFELSEYQQWAENYPTDLTYRFEWAKRLFHLGRYEDSIPAFQQAANDPKHRAEAAIFLGRAFYEAEYNEEAAQTLETAINEYPARNDEKSKELFYWRGRAREGMGDIEAALKDFSQVAQWEFGYRDVTTRVKKLREEQKRR